MTEQEIAAKWQDALDKWEVTQNAAFRLHDALGNLIGLCDLISHRDDIDPELKEILTSSWRRAEADAAFASIQRSQEIEGSTTPMVTSQDRGTP